MTIVLFFSPLFPVSATPGQQVWHLLGITGQTYSGIPADDGTSHRFDCIMSKAGTAISSWRDITHLETMWWYAEFPVQVDLIFSASGNWLVRIDHEVRSGWNWTVDVCKVANDGAVTIFATGTSSASASGTTLLTCHQDASQSFSVANEDRLALRIKHDDSTQTIRTYFNDGNDYFSSLTSPETDPAYPVSEFRTIILLSIGLVLLSGYTFLRSRRNRVYLSSS